MGSGVSPAAARGAIGAVVLLLACAARGSVATPGAPAGIEVPAALHPAGDVVEDAGASGGKAVTSAGEYHPLFTAACPPGDAFTVWVRRSGGPIQLKGVVAGKVVEKQWNWEHPEAYAWCSLGRYPRAELADGIVIIRAGAQPEAAPRIDCVVFSPDAAAHPDGYNADGSRALPGFEPNAAAPVSEARLTVHWEHVLGPVPRALWGINDCAILDPKQAADAKYQDYLKSLHPAFIRIHNAGLLEDWLTPDTHVWNVPAITQGFAASTGYGDAALLLNIPSVPAWMEKQYPDRAERAAAFVKLIGDLVPILKDQLKVKITYWELLNERDGEGEKNGDLPAVWALHNQLYDAIKKRDPAAKVGGPAFTWPKPAWVESFLKTCGSHVDFVSWHNYASGDIDDPNDYVFQRADALAKQAAYVKEQVAALVPNRKLDLFLDEYNVKWTWDPIERRHGNNVGAVFQSLVLTRMAALGLSGVAVWQSKGHAYGLIDADDTVRATGRLYQIGGALLVGDRVESASTDSAAVEVFAVLNADGGRTVMLINRTDHGVRTSSLAALGEKGDAVVLRIDAAGSGVVAVGADEPLVTPGYSVTVISSSAAAAAWGERLGKK
jgi:hypothetical protein